MILILGLFVPDLPCDNRVEPCTARVDGKKFMGILVEVEVYPQSFDLHHSSNSGGKVSQV